MPKVMITCQSACDEKEAFSRVRKILEEDKDLRKLDSKLVYDFEESTLSGRATGHHFKAEMSVSKENLGSRVEITVDLPFHLGLVKSIVQKTLQRKLDEALLT